MAAETSSSTRRRGLDARRRPAARRLRARGLGRASSRREACHLTEHEIIDHLTDRVLEQLSSTVSRGARARASFWPNCARPASRPRSSRCRSRRMAEHVVDRLGFDALRRRRRGRRRRRTPSRIPDPTCAAAGCSESTIPQLRRDRGLGARRCVGRRLRRRRRSACRSSCRSPAAGATRSGRRSRAAPLADIARACRRLERGEHPMTADRRQSGPFRSGRPRAADRAQGPAATPSRSRPAVSFTPTAACSRTTRSSASPTARSSPQQWRRVPRAPPAAERLRHVDAARRRDRLPEGCRADPRAGRHLSRARRRRGRRRLGRALALAAARDRARAAA